MDNEQAHALNTAIKTIGMRHRALAGVALNRIGLSVGQEVLMMELSKHGPRTQAQLAIAAGCEPPTITSAVQRLEAQDLVNRSTSTTDKRVTVVELSARGEALLDDLAIEWHGLADDSVADLSHTTITELISALTDLATSLKTATPRKSHDPT